MKELRVYGPPGTGKTTYLSRQIERAADKFGGENVLVASYTRTAGAEVVGRDLPVPERAVGTLHSHCYHALGRPKLADARGREFNEQYPAWRFDSSGGSAKAVLEANNRPKPFLLVRWGGKGQIAAVSWNWLISMLCDVVWQLKNSQIQF